MAFRHSCRHAAVIEAEYFGLATHLFSNAAFVYIKWGFDSVHFKTVMIIVRIYLAETKLTRVS